MNKLLHKAHRGKLSKRRTATVNDLRDFPKIGIHQDIYSKAVFLSNSRFEVSESEAVDLIKSKFYESAQRRNLQEGEVENAVRKAFNSSCSARCSNVLDIHHSNKTSDESFWNNDLEKLTADSITVGELKDYAKDYLWTVEDMWEDSPFRVDDCLPVEILSCLYKEDDLICIGTINTPQTRSLGEWKTLDVKGDLFCPNPMRVKVGINKEGNDSQRCRDNVGRRFSIVYECDELDLNFDQKASLIRCISEKSEANLRMVVHSGGKSLHAHFEATKEEKTNILFMNLLATFGGDKQMYYPEQTCRLPNAIRMMPRSIVPCIDAQGNTITQKCLYFDPR